EVLAVYGGAGMERQMKALGRGVEIVVATPGRLKDLLERGSLRLDDVNLVVVDEADRMADMGFLPEVRKLLDKTNPKRQTMLFSATLDGDVDVLIRHYQNDPVHHEAASIEEQGEVTHRFWAVSHGDRSQSQRERALGAFGRGQVHVLVATDVAARGIHVDKVACVLQYDPPATDKDYVHRSGRTGRAGQPGTVITLVSPEKEKDVRKMQRDLRRREPIETATVATAATILGSAPPKPIDRGDDLDGVSRRERARADDRPERSRGPKPARGKGGHRKGESPRKVEGDWTPRPKPATPTRNGQERSGAPARSGRPGAKPGRRPAGAGAARPGRPAGGNARRRSS
ncbi:MAG: DEAD/DEAH box helicase, partial [Acidimicrobiales bacterium]